VKTVSLLGTGWLGLPLGQALHATGWTVHASTTKPERIATLSQAGLIPHLIEIETTTPTPASAFWDSDAIIVTLPFRRSFPDPWVYVTQMQHIVQHLSPHQKLLLTSSTAYYPDCDHEVDEDLLFSPLAPRLCALAAAEAVIRAHPGPSTILRLGGLYGPDRYLRHFAKRALEKRHLHSVVNLVHRDDVLQIITHILRDDIGWGETFNVVSDAHPSRANVYKMENIPLSQPTSGKIVSNHKLKMALHYHFCYPDPLTSIEDTLP
jgi:nucleoside-diphosphate-sugar epimerase